MNSCAKVMQLLSTYRDLDDLVKHDIRRDVEIEDKVLEGGGTQSAVIGGHSLQTVPAYTPSFPHQSQSSHEQ